MLSSRARLLTRLGSTALAAVAMSQYRAAPAAQVSAVAPEVVHTITAGECATARVGTSIPSGLIGEPVSAVRVAEPRWGRSIVGTAGERSAPICSYPEYPRYLSGPPRVAASYRCQE